jgi:exodeoxyribonuclease VII small subunit
MPKKQDPPPEKSFEAVIKRLEEIVHSLEEQTPALDESLALYEEGKSLLALCLAKLDAAEQKMRILSKDDST